MDWATTLDAGITLRTGRENEILRIEPPALVTIARFRQATHSAPEAGGMLFATIESDLVRIVRATAPSANDRRSRFAFIPALGNQQRTIDKQFRSGLHFVGEWHTHPEPRPTPSAVDLRSMAHCFRESRHQLASLVMIIMGTEPTCDGLWISLHTATEFRCLTPTKAPSQSEQDTLQR